MIAEYVVSSESNVVAFKNDLVLDAKEFYEALSKYHASWYKQQLTILSELPDEAQPSINISSSRHYGEKSSAAHKHIRPTLRRGVQGDHRPFSEFRKMLSRGELVKLRDC